MAAGLAIPNYTNSNQSKAAQTAYEMMSNRSGKEQIKQAISEIAAKYGGNYYILYEVLICESSLNQSARGLAGEIGIAQFMPATWEMWNKERGTDLDIYSVKDQLNMIGWAFKQSYQKHWSCFKKLK